MCIYTHTHTSGKHLSAEAIVADGVKRLVLAMHSPHQSDGLFSLLIAFETVGKGFSTVIFPLIFTTIGFTVISS